MYSTRFLHLSIRQWASLEKCWSIITDMEPYTASEQLTRAGISGDINQKTLLDPHHQRLLSPSLITSSHQSLVHLDSQAIGSQSPKNILPQINIVLWLKPTRQLHILLNSDWVLGVWGQAGHYSLSLPSASLSGPSLASYCLLPGYLWEQKASGCCCPSSKTTPKWCLLCDGFIMEWHGGINHDWSLSRSLSNESELSRTLT